MRIDDIRISRERREAGAWVTDIPELGDLKLKVRGLGNSDYRRRRQELVEAIPEAKRLRGLEAEDRERIQTQVLAETVLLDWENLADAKGKAIAFSSETAQELLADPGLEIFREGVVWAATVVTQQRESARGATEKN